MGPRVAASLPLHQAGQEARPSPSGWGRGPALEPVTRCIRAAVSALRCTAAATCTTQGHGDSGHELPVYAAATAAPGAPRGARPPAPPPVRLAPTPQVGLRQREPAGSAVALVLTAAARGATWRCRPIPVASLALPAGCCATTAQETPAAAPPLPPTVQLIAIATGRGQHGPAGPW